MPFKKGQSGNPTGRPKALETVTEAARAHTAANIETLAKIRDNPDHPPGSRVAACVALLDRAWGRPAQAIALTGNGLNVNFILQNAPGQTIEGHLSPLRITGDD